MATILGLRRVRRQGPGRQPRSTGGKHLHEATGGSEGKAVTSPDLLG